MNRYHDEHERGRKFLKNKLKTKRVAVQRRIEFEEIKEQFPDLNCSKVQYLFKDR